MTLERMLSFCMPVPFSGCLIWYDRSIDGNGYGRIWHEGNIWLAHRLFFVLANGPIPDELDLDHLCRVPPCINPYHLEPVTRRVNIIRGISPMLSRLRQISKTHCRNGHLYLPENTYIRPNGDRLCKTCHREQSAKAGRKMRLLAKVEKMEAMP